MRSVNNAFYALLAQAMPKVSSTLLFVLLARALGRGQAGIYSLAVSFLTMGIILSSFGLEELLVREIARDPSVSRRYFANFAVLRALLSLIAYGVLWVVLRTVFRYDQFVETMALFLSLSLLPEALTDLTQGLFIATGHMRWMALSSTGISIAQFLVGAVVLSLGAGLPGLLAVIVVHSYLGCLANLALAALMLRRFEADGVTPPGSGALSLPFWRQQFRLTPAFVSMNTFSVLEAQLDVTLLSLFTGVEQAGLYGAAKTVISALAILSQAFRIAIYPNLVRLFATSLTRLGELYRRAFQYLAALSLALGVVLAVEAPAIIGVLYKAQFGQSVLPLRLLTVPLVIGFVYVPATRLMVASHRERQLAGLLAISFATNLLANLLLIRVWGAVGSASARVLSTLTYFILCELYVDRVILRTPTLLTLSRTIPCAGVLAVVLLVLRPLGAVPEMLVGLLAYAGLVFFLRCIDREHLTAVLREYGARARRMFNGDRGTAALVSGGRTDLPPKHPE